MTARQNVRIKSSVRAAFYPCCALGRDLGSEGLALGYGIESEGHGRGRKAKHPGAGEAGAGRDERWREGRR